MAHIDAFQCWRRSSLPSAVLPRACGYARPSLPLKHRTVSTCVSITERSFADARQLLPQQPRLVHRPEAGEGATATALYSQANTRQLTQQELIDFGATFVKHWFTGIAKGPAAVHPALTDMLHQDVTLMGDSVRIKHDVQVWHPKLAYCNFRQL